MTDLTDYEPQESSVVDIDRPHVDIYVDGELPSVGDAVQLHGPGDHTATAEVREHLGRRRIRALGIALPDWLEPSCTASTTGSRATLAVPEASPTEIGEFQLHPAGDSPEIVPLFPDPPDFGDLDPARPARDIGFKPIDVLAPVAEQGANLALDASPNRSNFEQLAERVVDALAPDHAIAVGFETEPTLASADRAILTDGDRTDHWTAVRLAIALGAASRDAGDSTLVVLELPTPNQSTGSETDVAIRQSIGQLLDDLWALLASTDAAPITVLVRLPVAGRASDLAPIIESLEVGDPDAQLVFDREGRFSPQRSMSDADIDDERRRERREALSMLRRADELEETRSLFGDDELSPDDRETLEAAEGLRRPLD